MLTQLTVAKILEGFHFRLVPQGDGPSVDELKELSNSLELEVRRRDGHVLQLVRTGT